ncbi:MAG: FAD-dependent oxidoreductase [Clostridia bacterium]|nr:FAD-dependent oxidoreductase [Clostridia bacterium]
MEYDFCAKAPLKYSAEVVVTGGGLAGCAAAIAAARNGADTLLVEETGMVGGLATLGYVGPLDATTKRNGESFGGLAEEIVESTRNLTKAYGGPNYYALKVAPEMLRFVLLDMLQKSGVKILFHANLIGVEKSQNEISHVYISTKSGIEVASAKRFIDATGDGDLIAVSGEEFVKGSEPGVFEELSAGNLDKIHYQSGASEKYDAYKSDGLMQPVSVMFSMGNVDCSVAQQYCNRMLTYNDLGITKEEVMKLPYFGTVGFEENGDYIPIPQGRVLIVKFGIDGKFALVNMSRVVGIDGTNAAEKSRAEEIAQMQILYLCDFLIRYVPGFENAYLYTSSHTLGVRETRRLVGKYVLKGRQVINCETFDDGVACGSYGIDIHDPQGKSKAIGGILKGDYYHIPYRCLLPKTIKNLLVAGRCISVDHVAHSSTRIQGTCIMTGQAAGTAAALSVKNNLSFDELNVSELREKLKKDGVIL